MLQPSQKGKMTEKLEKVDKNNDKEYVLKKKRAKAGDTIWLRV